MLAKAFATTLGVVYTMRKAEVSTTLISIVLLVIVVVQKNYLPLSVLITSNSCGVKKSAYLGIICAWMNRNLPWNGFRAQQYTVLLFVHSSHVATISIILIIYVQP